MRCTKGTPIAQVMYPLGKRGFMIDPIHQCPRCGSDETTQAGRVAVRKPANKDESPETIVIATDRYCKTCGLFFEENHPLP
jgi:RNA polymerase subunit RPABC4/transcription elongation factor Spt4